MRASSACMAGQPRARALASMLARTSALALGMASIPCISALKYSMVPPTSSGVWPRDWMSSIKRLASVMNSAAL
jgi:hypothetical protein